nr:unnamed protein product [Naegleria fowleri]
MHSMTNQKNQQLQVDTRPLARYLEETFHAQYVEDMFDPMSQDSSHCFDLVFRCNDEVNDHAYPSFDENFHERNIAADHSYGSNGSATTTATIGQSKNKMMIHQYSAIYVHEFFVMARSDYVRKLLKGHHHDSQYSDDRDREILRKTTRSISEVMVHSETLKWLSLHINALYRNTTSHLLNSQWFEEAQLVEMIDRRKVFSEGVEQFANCVQAIFHVVSEFNRIQQGTKNGNEKQPPPQLAPKYSFLKDTFDLTIQLYNPYCVEELMKEYRVHKLFLFRSPFMKKILQSGMNETQTNIVKFHTISVEGFNHVLQYLYTQHCNVPREHVVEIYVFAQLMELSDLSSVCVKLVTKMIDKDNVFDVLSLEELSSIPSILEACAQPRVHQKIAFYLANAYESIPSEVYGELSVDIRMKVQKIRKKKLLSKK